ncbi:MAG: hypothetical protein K8T25_17155 [Planctomycetia bacterium]|nr:hypothetical protein [Planctomycetia bacterium]
MNPLRAAGLVALLAAAGFVNPARAHAQAAETAGGWVKSAANPVLGGKLGTCFDVCVLKEGDVYRMWFSWRPKKSIALVESRDGVHWSQPVIVLGPNGKTGWEGEVNRPIVIRNDAVGNDSPTAGGASGPKYQMWYTGQTLAKSWIGYATSPDGKTWHRESDKPVLSAERPWEKVAVMCPHVMYDGPAKTYRMWYSGGEQGEPNAIGYATSPDGLKWTKHADNPVFRPDPSSPWEKQRVTACQVIAPESATNGKGTADGSSSKGGSVKGGSGKADYVMFYIGFRDENHAQIGIARSPDGITGWQRHPANPIVRIGPNHWDHDAVYKPFAVYDGQQWLLWYNGRRAHVEQIGLATHDGRDLGF